MNHKLAMLDGLILRISLRHENPHTDFCLMPNSLHRLFTSRCKRLLILAIERHNFLPF
jgi:hypothetical protein